MTHEDHIDTPQVIIPLKTVFCVEMNLLEATYTNILLPVTQSTFIAHPTVMTSEH